MDIIKQLRKELASVAAALHLYDFHGTLTEPGEVNKQKPPSCQVNDSVVQLQNHQFLAVKANSASWLSGQS